MITILHSETVNQAGQSSRFPALAFEVDDLEKAISELKGHGIELPWGIEEDSDSRWVMFYDAAGNLVELTQ